MVESKELNKLTKAELLEMADQEGLMSQLSEPLTEADKKDVIVEALSSVATPEMVAARLDAKNSDNQDEDSDNAPTNVQVHDPAVAPAEEVNESPYEIAVGDKVSYPYKDASGGRMVGKVRATNGSIATVTYADGGERQFSVAVLKKV